MLDIPGLCTGLICRRAQVTPRAAKLADYLHELREDYDELMAERETMRGMLLAARR